ncbi:sigma-70 family RNA polymerase sigma factor [Streptomyces liliifuscus]|uniref:Sigma-70 family RNA polymerase sigma factor n=1 Tax=Streptomyces liliifuscus TaxID=2797636 RepID=A0A7T7I650_9ACTN|nr:sigma-70 family RNA polymerase sigma factor [Streptomyces liliifuscus]QQM41725.1 sigma-70 family RNA polymerase sigma factor [Streptomyces liliifuscus]
MSGDEFLTPEEKAEGKSEDWPQGKRNEHGNGGEDGGRNGPGSAVGTEILALRFETHRARLRAVAHRMLGSPAEADDAVQEAWLRLSRSDTSEVANLGGWLTTAVGRICLDMLRSRRTRREEPLDEPGVRLPEPLLAPITGADPEQEALLADSVGLALLVVLETLGPAERLALVLHDLFAVPFDEVATVVGRSPAATRQLASRARRRVQGGASAADADPDRQREVVDAFLAAARDGDFDGLVAVLDPDVVARSGAGVTTGAAAVASGAITFGRLAAVGRPALVNGSVGVVGLMEGRLVSVLSFTVVHGRIAAIDIVREPERLAGLDVTFLEG